MAKLYAKSAKEISSQAGPLNPGRILPAGSYRIGRGSAAHGYPSIDLPAPKGTPIYAMSAGAVNRAAFLNTSYGHHVILNHANRISTLYAHMDRIMVRLGQQVMRGQQIGTVDSTGNSTGHHLHFELRRNGARVRPEGLVPRPYDTGGILPPGGLAFNGTSRPEAVLSPRDSASFQQLVGSLRSGSGQGGEFTGKLYLDSGELLGVVRGQVRQETRGISRGADLYGRTG
jgi:hypothetical protein